MVLVMSLEEYQRARKHPDLKRRLSFLIAIVAGLLLLITGVSGSLGILAYALNEISFLIPEVGNVFRLTLVLLAIVASSGGIAVIIGGYLVLRKRTILGKLVISLGGGVGSLGFIINLISGISLAWALLSSVAAIFVVGRSLGWIGVILSVIARVIA